MARNSRGIYTRARLKFATPGTYAEKPSGNWNEIPVMRIANGVDQPLTPDPRLGQGREPNDPTPEIRRVNPSADVPLDLRNFGYWLKAAYGAPLTSTARATGKITFSGQPAATSTLTLNGATWTFVSGSPTGNQTQIGANLAATLTALATDLNASADSAIDDAIYAATATELVITHKTPGTAGNAFALAASANSNGTVGAATLRGGCYEHVFTGGGPRARGVATFSGQPANNSTLTLGGTAWTFVTGTPSAGQTKIQADLATTLAQLAADLNASADAAISRARYANGPTTLTVELKEPDYQASFATAASSSPASNATWAAVALQLAEYLPDAAIEMYDPAVPLVEVITGAKLNTIELPIGRAGQVNARIAMIAQDCKEYGTTQAGTPASLAVTRFLGFQGSLTLNGAALGKIVSGSSTYGNGLEAFDDVADRETIAEIEEGVAEPALALTARVSAAMKAALIDAASSRTPVAIENRWYIDQERSLTEAWPRLHLPRPAREVPGPGGVDMTFNMMAAKDPTALRSKVVTLRNDVASY